MYISPVGEQYLDFLGMPILVCQSWYANSGMPILVCQSWYANSGMPILVQGCCEGCRERYGRRGRVSAGPRSQEEEARDAEEHTNNNDRKVEGRHSREGNYI